MIPDLNDLLSDKRLARLFSEESRPCALQLWVLCITSETVENRILYGRLLPYNYANDTWYFSNNDKQETFGEFNAKVSLLNLYIQSKKCANLLRDLSDGLTISQISEKFELTLTSSFKKKFGSTALPSDNLVYRPVSYLLNRDGKDRRSLSSPHCGAGAYSASITQTDKRKLLCLGEYPDVALTESVIRHLNADTGLDFGSVDTPRFGDLELLVFPTLNDKEQSLLNVSWFDNPKAFVARFNPMQVPYFTGFLFRLSITNDGQIVYSGVTLAAVNVDNEFEGKFELGDQLQAMTDSTELEIFGFYDDSLAGSLCCRWQMGHIREVQVQYRLNSSRTSPIKFDWLEKTTPASNSARVKISLTPDRGNQRLANRIGGRKADTWVSVNRDLLSLVARIYPPKSEGQFFLRWSQSNGEGRLQFVEWFRSILTKYQHHQIIIFDPYFEDIGLHLLLICAADNAEFVAFRSLPKVRKRDQNCSQSDETAGNGIYNLLTNCRLNRNQLKRFGLRIYGLKEGQLHDRYILIMGQDSLPLAGFHLSNSFQKATENYPLLVTPIPSDVLLTLEQYKSDLLRKAQIVPIEGETEYPVIKLLFDSANLQVGLRHCNDPFRFLEKSQAGDVLSMWVGNLSLQGLSGDLLRERMVELEFIKDDSLTLPETPSLQNCLNMYAGDFSPTWEILGELLAHTACEDFYFSGLESETEFWKFLAKFLTKSFDRALDDGHKELAVIDAHLFCESIDNLLHSPSQLQNFINYTKYTALSWSEYYSIMLLWKYDPKTLLEIAEAKMASLDMESLGSDRIRLSLLSQIISQISISIESDISKNQRNYLVHSSNGLLRWMGMNAVEMELSKPSGLDTVLELIADFSRLEQIRVLGWMLRRAQDDKKADFSKNLADALLEVLPDVVDLDELTRLIDSMRGHKQVKGLAWAGPWLFDDVVFPLLQKDRAKTDDACKIWVEELNGMLEPQQEGLSHSFEPAREGNTTNITAYLFAYSNPHQQQDSLGSMQAILRRQKQIVQRPLASTSNSARWNRALIVSMWILTFSKLAKYYLNQRGMSVSDLDQLSHNAQEQVLVKPMKEWRSKGTGVHPELVSFLDQVEKLLTQDGK